MKDSLKIALLLREQTELVKLIEDAEREEKHFDAVLVYNRDILCSDPAIRQEVIDYLKTLGIEVVFYEEEIKKKSEVKNA